MLTLVAALLLQISAADSITVTASRTEVRIADTPASVVVLSKAQLDATATPVLANRHGRRHRVRRLMRSGW